MDQQLKTRLIGVTIVVSLVVIFVPMLFEDSGDREAVSIGTANVPEFPQELQSQALPLPSATPKMAALPPVAEPTPVRDEPLDPLDVPAAGGEQADDMGGHEGSAYAQDALLPEKAPVKERAVRPAATPSATIAPAKAKPTVKEAPAKPAAVEAKPADKPKPASAAESAVKTPSAAAPAAAAKPKAAPAKPLPADAKPGPAVAPAAPVKMSAWIIQAGSFGDEANAKTLLVKLRQANIAAFVEMIPSASGNSYRVRVGPELDRARAEATLKKMETEAGVKGMIVSYP